MKGVKKCFGLLLPLFIIFGLFLSVSSDASALQHDYKSIPLLRPRIPLGSIVQGGDNLYRINWLGVDSSNWNRYFSPRGFLFQAFGTAFEEYYNNIFYKNGNDSSIITLGYSSDTNLCMVSSVNPIFSFPDLTRSSSSFSFGSSANNGYFYPDSYPVFSTNQEKCHRRHKFGESTMPELSDGSLNFFRNVSCNDPNYGATCAFGAYVEVSPYIRSVLLPYWYSYDGIYLHDEVTLIDGTEYKYNLNFSDLFNTNVGSFSYLSLPLWSYDDYWTIGDNFYAGRHFEFKGHFSIPQSSSFTPAEASASLRAGTTPKVEINMWNPSSRSLETLTYDCSTSVNIGDPFQTGDTGVTDVSYSCSFNLPYQTPFMFPTLIFNNINDDSHNTFVLKSHSFSFGFIQVITDHDDTPGFAFGNNLTGNNIPGSASDHVPEEHTAEGIFESFKNLFVFNMINPFSPFFDMFSDADNCADITTIARLIHLPQTQVCPWFNSGVRAVTTPVFVLLAPLLIFAFVMRWLGGGSGQVYDTGLITPHEHIPIMSNTLAGVFRNNFNKERKGKKSNG